MYPTPLTQLASAALERRRSRRGQTGPHDLLALGASHPHIAVVAAAADIIAAAAVTAAADPTSLHLLSRQDAQPQSIHRAPQSA